MKQLLHQVESFWPSNTHVEEVVEVVLIEPGIDPSAVAHVLQQVMNLTLTDPGALVDAMPLVLYEGLEWSKAERIGWQLRLAGATVTIRHPRQRYTGIRRPFLSRQAA